jgi:hypothetical protein
VDGQRIDDMGPPFHPATLEEFLAQAGTTFQRWWDELDPVGTCDQIKLDCTTARSVWLAAYEHQTDAIGLVYDSAAIHGGSCPTVAELHLGYVVDRFHFGRVVIPTRAFTDWLAQHEDDFCSYIDDSDQVHVRIKSKTDEPLPEDLGRRPHRIGRSSAEAVRAGEAQRFSQWWDGLDPPGSYEGRSLNVNETRVVWFAACVQVWETLELVHESAHAHSDVRSATAELELAYIVDWHHNGKLAFSLEDLMDWCHQHEDDIRRNRSEDGIATWIETSE